MTNAVVLEGRLVSKPDLKYTQSGKPVCSFSLAFNHSQDNASFFECVAWENYAELIAQEDKGTSLKVVGYLKQDKWTTSEGANRSKVKLVAEYLRIYPRRQEANETA